MFISPLVVLFHFQNTRERKRNRIYTNATLALPRKILNEKVVKVTHNSTMHQHLVLVSPFSFRTAKEEEPVLYFGFSVVWKGDSLTSFLLKGFIRPSRSSSAEAILQEKAHKDEFPWDFLIESARRLFLIGEKKYTFIRCLKLFTY